MHNSRHSLIWHTCQFTALISIIVMDYWTGLQFVTFSSRDGSFGTTKIKSETAFFTPKSVETDRKRIFGNRNSTVQV